MQHTSPVPTTSPPLNRKQFLKAAACGLCAPALASMLASPRPAHAQAGGASQTAQRGLVRPHPSPWFSPVDGNAVQCGLCPRQCTLAPGQRSPCRARENRSGQGVSLTYANPALIQEDPVERKPFFHVVPGSRALSVSTAGCNLHCKFCEVWDMALVRPEDVHAYDLSPEAVVAHAQAAGLRSVSFAFGEPVIFYEYMLDVARLARNAGMLNLLHTAAYIRPEPLQELCEVIDAANVDLKGFDPAFYREVVGGELQPVLDALRIIKRSGVHLELTSVVIPTLNDDMDALAEMCRWIAGELGPDTPLHLARFYPLYRLSALPRTPVSILDQARETAQNAGLRFVYVAKVPGHDGENTFCPDCGQAVITRVGFIVDQMRVDNGRCPDCQREIPGIWS
ncbi:AmmeMemoRadiSam system radical SAM enzyme [Desulfonatronum thioautotrophicum]|uniref:AmmeMemoRadiSam system radical SAM enzyme n=1 Tax=Desulfonatronum thioautotrophicum TaxID=617001 RepID=UPI0005EBDC28|nr:AmmeMemoRadiSam system radical SAM enzyme [Desulfonatronum thioautotrophicum]